MQVTSHKNISLLEAQRYCRRLARAHYENFTVGSLLLPRGLRQHVYNVYAYARVADDFADELLSDEESLAKLTDWEHKLEACYQGETDHPVFVALADTIQQFQIPITPFRSLLRAFRQDRMVKCYSTFNDLLGYCQNSANPVGHIFFHLFRYRDPALVPYADAICTALQLTNFWQDIPVDLQKGRIYIPLEDMTSFGYSEAELTQHIYNENFRRLLEFEVERTQELFDRGKGLIPRVGKDIELEIRLFISGGESILQALRKSQYDVFRRRPKLSKLQKMTLLAKNTVGIKFQRYICKAH